MTTGKIHEGDTPTFRVLVKDNGKLLSDLADVETKTIAYKKEEDGDIVIEKPANFCTDGTDSMICHTFGPDDLTAGNWRFQIYVKWGESQQWRSNIISFKVYENL